MVFYGFCINFFLSLQEMQKLAKRIPDLTTFFPLPAIPPNGPLGLRKQYEFFDPPRRMSIDSTEDKWVIII